MMNLKSYAYGEWIEGSSDGTPILDAVHGTHIYNISSEGLNFKDMLVWGRSQGGPRLRALTFHQRALLLKQLAQYILSRKDELYALSYKTGATKGDSWIDIEGGTGTLFTYASKGRRELPDKPFLVEGALERVSKNNTFAGQHICVPLEGVAVHINAFNFPCWGMLEKISSSFLAGMPTIVKPASTTAYVAEHLVRIIVESGILPQGAIQLICGSTGDLFKHLSCQDVVTLTGSKVTGSKLKNHPKVLENSVRFNLEADSLNCTILAPDATPDTAEFRLFVSEMAKELTVKAGQKCTVMRRAIVPESMLEDMQKALRAELEKVVIGDPEEKGVRMGPLVSLEQRQDVLAQVERIKESAELIYGATSNLVVADRNNGAFLGHIILLAKDPFQAFTAHTVEAFGPVATIFPYKSIDEAIELARRGEGSLCASVFTTNEDSARELCFGLAPYHGRILLMNEECSQESTGHGSPLPHLVHGGPGRAGGGEELGGIRSVLHYMQRTALQGSPSRLASISEQWLPGARTISTEIHPFQKHFEELEIGEMLLTKKKTITEADIVNFAELSGDHFYAHMDDASAQTSIFKARVAHGYFIISAAAGLFVDPALGPVLANYGLENLRFVTPVYIGDTIQVRLICMKKTPRYGEDRGVVEWQVEIENQLSELVASYSVLTLVRAKSAFAVDSSGLDHQNREKQNM